MEDLDLRQLRYFVVVAEELHFTRAAERLGIQQPPLSVQIRNLEKKIGCDLLTRGSRHFGQTQLTAAGVKLLEEARRILAQAESALRVTRGVSLGETGHLRVGVPPSVMLSKFTAGIRLYRERYPKIHFTLHEMGTSAVAAALRAREIDIGFLRERKAPVVRPFGFTTFLFTAEPLVAVLPANHKLAKEPGFRLRSMRKEPFVYFPRHIGPEFHDALLADCGRAGFVPHIVQEATQWPTIVSLVEAGMGVSIAPACVEKFAWPGVVYRRLPGLATQIFAAWGRYQPAIRFYEIAQQALRER